jgi:hypothetical protein
MLVVGLWIIKARHLFSNTATTHTLQFSAEQQACASRKVARAPRCEKLARSLARLSSSSSL